MKMFRVVVNGSEYKVGIEELAADTSARTTKENPPSPTAPQLQPALPKSSGPAPQQPKQPVQSSGNGDGTIVAPMPGTIIKVIAEVGGTVLKGQTLLILEAMKMENDIMAPCDGTVQEVIVSQGASVNAGDILVVLTS